jgi:hypothetical protein
MSDTYSKISDIDSMDNDFFNAIEYLLKNYSGMTNSRVLFIMYNKIESLLLQGYYTVEYLAKKLNEHGFNITKKSLKTELFRIRKKLGRESPRIIRNKYDYEFGYSSELKKIKILELFNRDSSDLIYGDFRKPYEFKDKTKNAAKLN